MDSTGFSNKGKYPHYKYQRKYLLRLKKPVSFANNSSVRHRNPGTRNRSIIATITMGNRTVPGCLGAGRESKNPGFAPSARAPKRAYSGKSRKNAQKPNNRLVPVTIGASNRNINRTGGRNRK